MDAERFAQMLKEQTAQLMQANKQAVRDAVREVETRLTKQMAAVRVELADELKARDAKLQDLHQEQQRLREDVEKLLEKGVSKDAGDGERERNRQPAVIFGGWEPDTHRDVIMKELDQALRRADVGSLLDSAPWVPGVRKHYALALFHARARESEEAVRSRMMAMVNQFQQAQWDDGRNGRRVWAAMSKSPSERGKGQHASKIRKLLYLLSRGVQGCEAEYSTGSVWLDGILLGSASRTAPDAATRPGRAPNSWIDLRAVARAASSSEDEVAEMWERAWLPN